MIGRMMPVKKALFCECKFRNKPMPMEEYDDLVMAAEMFRHVEKKHLMFFSKSRFRYNL